MTIENAQTRYRKATLVNVQLQFNRNTDSDIINHLQTIPNKQGYIKQLIRADIAKTEKGDQTMIDVKYFDAAVALMDDEIREEIHASGKFDGDKAGFLQEYCKRHKEKYGTDFAI